MSYWLNKEMALYDVAEMITNLDCTEIYCVRCPFYTQIGLLKDGEDPLHTCAKSNIGERLEEIKHVQSMDCDKRI